MNITLNEKQKAILRSALASELAAARASEQEWLDSGSVIPVEVPRYVREVKETVEQVEQAVHAVETGRSLAGSERSLLDAALACYGLHCDQRAQTSASWPASERAWNAKEAERVLRLQCELARCLEVWIEQAPCTVV